jgi:hypothetical protein
MMYAIFIRYLILIFQISKCFFLFVKLPYSWVVNDDVFIDF